MQRRELIKVISALTGAAFVGNDALWALAEPQSQLPYSDADVEFFDDIADTILPRTDTPGARDAAVGPFMARYSAACYPSEHIELLRAGLLDINARMLSARGKGYWQADAREKVALLTQIDAQAKGHALAADKSGGAPHYFTLMKQLTLFGFFTSEAGATQVVRYRPIPGRYRGCIPYNAEPFWAW